MSETTIRARILTDMQGVSNIGNVYDYKRQIVDKATQLSLLKVTISSVDQIRAWFISREDVSEKQLVIGANATDGTEKIHKYLIQGWLGLRDSTSTEKTLNTLIEAITAAFRTDRTLNGTCWLHEGIQVTKISQDTINDILCNCCELNLIVKERS